MTIKKLASIVARVVGYKEKVTYDKDYPDGHLKKINDIKLQKKFGCKPKIDLIKGINRSYKDFLKRY